MMGGRGVDKKAEGCAVGGGEGGRDGRERGGGRAAVGVPDRSRGWVECEETDKKERGEQHHRTYLSSIRSRV